MKRFIVASLLCVALCGIALPAERPVVNVPPAWRQSNWLSSRGEGSCVHAAFITLLRWQGRINEADRWKRKHDGGEWSSTFAGHLEQRQIRYAYVTNGDVAFLEWACRTRRGCGITVDNGSHMVTLVHLDDEWAVTLDNNYTSTFIWIPREELIAEWRASYGWAVTPVYTPMAPLPEFTETPCYPE